MTMHVRVLTLAVCLSALIGFTAQATDAAEIRRQAPCAGRLEYCVRFDGGGEIPVIRTFRVNAPRAGTAAVSFHGSLICGKFSRDTPGERLFDITTQIVAAADAVPVATGPGGLRFFAVVQDAVADMTPAQTFNLASTRVFTVQAAGTHTYHFKIAAVRMAEDTACVVYNAAFTVLFVP